MTHYLQKSRLIRVVAAFCLGAGILAGCEASVDPILSTDRNFTMYGTLSSSSDTQTVRVYPIGARLEPTPGEKLGATFTSENLTTGEVRTWNDSVHTEPDGQRVHVFWSEFAAERGQNYRLEVSSAERGTTHADLTVPPDVEAVGMPAEFSPGRVIKRVRIPGAAPEVADPATVIYNLKFDAASPQQGVPPPATLDKTTLEAPVVKEDGTWYVEIPLDQHFEALDRRYDTQRRINANYGIFLFGLEVRIQVVSEGWTIPERELTADLVVQPGVRSNVVGGFGFVGAGYTQTTFIETAKDAETAAGFREQM